MQSSVFHSNQELTTNHISFILNKFDMSRLPIMSLLFQNYKMLIYSHFMTVWKPPTVNRALANHRLGISQC
jgi:hypothetical protein